ncbi:MAG: hydroxyneurosporene dehydrogenase [Spirochaetes bacterium]|nr:hydroxyneurosporene dehydrogenase [Spirochaetota bacterium]
MKARTLLAPMLAAALIGCASTGPATGAAAHTAASAGEFSKLGLSPTRIEPWEDGARMSGGRGTYEWWYFDFSLDDGSTLVIVYLTKDFTRPQAPLSPVVTFSFDGPDGTTVSRAVTAEASDFSAAKDRCDVRIGACTAAGDLRGYTVHYEDADVSADLRLAGTVPAWRPGTGHAFFAWLPSVPKGTVEGTLSIGGATPIVTGVGYHDHNWGNAPLLDLVHDWYWGRARIGDYTVISSTITATDRYGGAALPVFMLALGDAIIADDAAKVRFSADEVFTDTLTGKPVAGRLVYEYEDGSSRYRITYRRATDLVRTMFVDLLTGFKRSLARLAGFDGAYLRFAGTATLERFEDGRLVETVSQESAVWELMYFGHAPR